MRTFRFAFSCFLMVALLPLPTAVARVGDTTVPSFAMMMNTLTASADAGAAVKAMDDILRADSSSVPRELRQKLVREFLHQTIHPSSVRQGNHNTCAVAALESRLYLRSPSIVAEILRDVVMSREVKSRSGAKAKVDAAVLVPDNEAQLWQPGGKGRSYASQLFQLTSVNLVWQSRSVDPRGIKVVPGSISYTQTAERTGGTDTGERLYIEWQGGARESVLSSDGMPVAHPSFTCTELKALNRLLTGRAEAPFILDSIGSQKATGVEVVKSEKKLHAALTKLARAGDLPALVAISWNPGLKLFSPSGEQKRFFDQFHVVSVTAYDDQSQSAQVDNWWGINDVGVHQQLELRALLNTGDERIKLSGESRTY